MDMDVDEKIFGEIRSSLNYSKRQLCDAMLSVRTAVSVAGRSLEGQQYTFSVETAAASCDILETTNSNIDSMQDYISRLEDSVHRYLNCKYDG